MRIYTKLGMTASACAMVMATAPAFAQEASVAPPASDQADEAGQISDIVVTAQKRAQNLQDVPVAVTAFTGSALQDRGIVNVGELTTITPGLQIGSSNGVALPFLRGIGTTSFSVGVESSVAVYTDGIYYTRLPQGFLALNNIERVEVLKGPQGTLFGRNSSGGIVNIITPDPSHNFAVRGSVGYGRFDTFRGDLYVTGGLADNLAADITIGGTNQEKGWGTNLATGNKAGFQNDFTVRSKLLFEPGDDTRLVLTGFYSYSLGSSQGNVFPGFTRGTREAPFELITTLPNFYDQDQDIDGRSKAEAWGVSLKAEQNLGFATLTSISGYTENKERIDGDGDYGTRPDFIYVLDSKIEQFTQELQLTGDGGGPLDWVLGLYYYDAKSRYNPAHFYGALFAPADLFIHAKQHVKAYAAYAQATYEVARGLSLTGGLRYTRDKMSGEGFTDLEVGGVPVGTIPAGSDSRTFNKLTFRTAVDYQFTPDILGYVSFSRGYKSAGYNLLPFEAPPQKPETLDAYEVGFKTDLFDRRLRLNISGFWYDVSNPQVQLNRNGSVFLSNADSSRVKGIELEGQVAFGGGFTGRFGFTYLDSKYRKYLDAPSGPPNPNPPYGAADPLISIDASGNRTPLAAKIVFNLGADYVIETGHGDVQLSADYYHNSGYYFEPDNLLHQKAFDLLSGQIKYSPTDNLAVRFWGKNLLGEKYVSWALTQAGAPGYPFVAGAPRTYGVSVDFNF